MSELRSHWGNWRADVLRERFRPRSRIAQAWLSAVPWISVMLIVGLFWVVGDRMRVQPGVAFDLPPAPFREGMHYGLTAVMLPVSRPSGQSETLVFFEDEPYSTAVPAQVRQLGEALRNRAARETRRELLLLADRRVSHGDVMAAVELARAAGIQRINVAAKPE
jgi:biopolymer transport protein ExbD